MFRRSTLWFWFPLASSNAIIFSSISVGLCQIIFPAYLLLPYLQGLIKFFDIWQGEVHSHTINSKPVNPFDLPLEASISVFGLNNMVCECCPHCKTLSLHGYCNIRVWFYLFNFDKKMGSKLLIQTVHHLHCQSHDTAGLSFTPSMLPVPVRTFSSSFPFCCNTINGMSLMFFICSTGRSAVISSWL